MAYGTGLEISYRRGKLMAGYVTLPRKEGDRAVRSRKTDEGLVIDYASDGRVIGVEIPTPTGEALQALLRIMKDLDCPEPEKELRPLQQVLAATAT